jgi:hypothetical protein
VKPRFGLRITIKDAEGVSAMRYFSRTAFEGGNGMSRKDAVVLAARTLAALLTVWALTDVSYLPERLHSFVYYLSQEATSSASIEHFRHYYRSKISRCPDRRLLSDGEVAL